MKIVSNSYDASVGRFSGGQIQITSKSGTNDSTAVRSSKRRGPD